MIPPQRSKSWEKNCLEQTVLRFVRANFSPAFYLSEY